jgi:hypothetical protein
MANRVKLPSKEYLDACLSYNKDTGELIWRQRPVEHFKSYFASRCFNGQYAGTVAGYPNWKGHITIFLGKKAYYAHRIIWKMVTGEDPVDEIDHIDGVKSDNSLKNLRQATGAQNQRNRTKYKSNSTGFKGVSLDRAKDKYVAQISVDGKNMHIGYFDSPEKAYAAYCEKARVLHGAFANVK